MSMKAKVLKGMYQAGRVALAGLRQAVSDGVITEAELDEITEV